MPGLFAGGPFPAIAVGGIRRGGIRDGVPKKSTVRQPHAPVRHDTERSVSKRIAGGFAVRHRLVAGVGPKREKPLAPVVKRGASRSLGESARRGLVVLPLSGKEGPVRGVASHAGTAVQGPN